MRDARCLGTLLAIVTNECLKATEAICRLRREFLLAQNAHITRLDRRKRLAWVCFLLGIGPSAFP